MTEHQNTPAHESTRAIQYAWISLATWTAVIALESFAGSSQNTSHILGPLLNWLFGPLPPLTFFEIHFAVRKLGHFSGYGILGLFAFRAWWTTLAARKNPRRNPRLQPDPTQARVIPSERDRAEARERESRDLVVSSARKSLSWRAMLRNWTLPAAALAVLTVFTVAGADEFHQAFEPGRGSSFHDVILDTMGGTLAVLVLLEISEWRRARALKRLAHASPRAEETVGLPR